MKILKKIFNKKELKKENRGVELVIDVTGKLNKWFEKHNSKNKMPGFHLSMKKYLELRELVSNEINKKFK